MLPNYPYNCWHPFTSDPPLGPKRLIVRAEGAYLFESNGHRLFDGTSSWWCNIHGHSNPRLVEALYSQARVLDQMLFAPHSHPVAEEFAELILRKLGQPFSKVFFSDNGSTSIEVALKMVSKVWQFRGESKRVDFVSLKHAYHGDTLGAASLGGIEEYHSELSQMERRLDGTLAEAPYCHQCPLGKNFPECDIACLSSLREKVTERTAALVIEPIVMGAAGMVNYPPEFLRQAVLIAKAKGALVIIDEVFSGFGRTGPLFAMEHVDVRGDFVCLSKGLTSGMLPMGVTVTTDEIYREFCGKRLRTFFHGHTFTGNALSCRVALESLKMFDELNVLESNQSKIAVLSDGVTRFKKHPLVSDARGIGMIWAIECVDEAQIPMSHERLWNIASFAWERGLWIRPLHNVLYLVPPYCSTQSEVKWALDIIEEGLNEVS